MKGDVCRVTSGEWRESQPRAELSSHPSRATRHSAFTLIEVMIAAGILFACLFAILGLVSNCLRNARTLQQHKHVDAGMAAAMLYVQFTTTNRVSEGSGRGDFGDAYPDYSYDWNLQEIETNHLCQLDVAVRKSGGKPESSTSIYLYVPSLQGGRP
jgi:type II secretory pathway pseudopilin PulG